MQSSFLKSRRKFAIWCLIAFPVERMSMEVSTKLVQPVIQNTNMRWVLFFFFPSFSFFGHQVELYLIRSTAKPGIINRPTMPKKAFEAKLWVIFLNLFLFLLTLTLIQAWHHFFICLFLTYHFAHTNSKICNT